MAVGRISGPLLKDNLLRNGVDLSFETSLLYLDVTNRRVGINTATPQYDLDVNGVVNTTNLQATNSATIASFTISGNTIASSNSTINLLPSSGGVVYQGTISVGNFNISGNSINNTVSNNDINITAVGTGFINLNNNTLVTGDLHATGNITADGNIILGNSSTDTVTFDSEINSDIIPSSNSAYNLGSTDNRWKNIYTTTVNTTSISNTNLNVTGTLTSTGTTNLNGNTTIGVNSFNSLNIVAQIDSNIVPKITNTYNLGSSTLLWSTGYIGTLQTAGLTVSSNSITSTGTNSNLQLSASGTGNVYLPNNNLQVDNSATITGNLTVNGTTTLSAVIINNSLTQTGDFTQTGNFSTSGNFTATGTTTITGNLVATSLSIPNITISGNTITTNTGNLDLNLAANGTGKIIFQGITVNNNNIQSNTTNADLLLTPNGTGSVVINNTQSLVIPVGTTLDRPTGANGMIRYNTVTNFYEGYSNGYWAKLSGVQSIDGKTYITPESSPGAGDNIIRFYANNVNSVYIDSTKLYASDFQTSGIDISNNTISAISTNSDLNLTTSGTGGVVIGNLKFTSNSITNMVSGAVTTFNETGTGYVKISGTNGVVIPVGSSEPLVAELGMIRYNSSLQYVEMYTGGADTGWQNVAGAAAGVTQGDATDLSIVYAVLFG
jgi:hypothetical protein